MDKSLMRFQLKENKEFCHKNQEIFQIPYFYNILSKYIWLF